MGAVGGDIREITYNHPTIGQGSLFAKAAEDSNFDPGGFRVNDDKNNIDGGGNRIKIMNQVCWSFDTTISNDMNSKNELEKLSALSASPLDADWTISHINGTVWAGKGGPVGDVTANGNTGTMPLKLMGPGKLKKII